MIEIVLGCAIVIIVVLSILLYTALARERALQKSLDEYENYYLEVHQGISYLLKEMRAIDIRGSFESDDEVGIIFRVMVNIIASLKTFIQLDTDEESVNAAP